MDEIEIQLSKQQHELEQFLKLYKTPGFNLEVKVNHVWTSRDLLAHIVAWHESFARNVELLAAAQPADPPRGTLRQVNRDGVIALTGLTVPQLIRRARRAQRTIDAHIADEAIKLIPYRKPGTSYTPIQHLDVVRGHINSHFWQLVEKQFGSG